MADEDIKNDGDLENTFTDAMKENPPAQEKAAEATPPVETTPPAPPEPSPEPTGPSDLFQAAEKLGIATDGLGSDEALLEAVYKQVQEARPYVEYAQRVLPYNDRVKEILEAQQQPEPTEEEKWSPQSHFHEKWQAPNYDPAWQSLIDKGMVVADPDTGHFVPAKGFEHVVSPEITRGITEYQDFQRRALNDHFTNPYEKTWDAFQEPLERIIQQQVDERMRQMLGYQEEQNAVQKYEQEHIGDLYELDGDGAVIHDLQGQPKMTEYGVNFANEVYKLRDAGLSAEDILKYAEATCAPQRTNGKTETAKKKEPEPPKKEESFLSQAMDKASHSPSGGAYAEGEEIPASVRNKQELDNMFVDAAKKGGL